MGKRLLEWIGLLAVSPLLLLVVVSVAIYLSLQWLYSSLIRLAVELVWGLRGKRVLLVYSRSPAWQEYIETNWLPVLGTHAIVLDWSDRSTWKFRLSFAARVFRAWAPDRDFNPMAILIPRFGALRHIGFFYAFRDWKHGKTASLESAESELLAFVHELRKRSG